MLSLCSHLLLTFIASVSLFTPPEHLGAVSDGRNGNLCRWGLGIHAKGGESVASPASVWTLL